jgi:hypothetical protein
MGTTKSTRRKFLSGSVAAPLILTVQSASALPTPASSSSLCRTNDLNAAIPPAGYLPLPTADINNPDPDAWLRKEIQIVTLTQGTPPVAVPGYFVRSLNGSAYYSVNKDDPTALPQLSTLVPGGYTETPFSTRRGLVLVDSSGNTVAFQWENSAGQKISKSCWTSFRP